MRWVPILLLILEVHGAPSKRRKTQIYMASIDLDTNRKRNIDPEVIPEIGSQLPPAKRNVTQAPDYGDYEDYELTVKPEEPTTTVPIRTKVGTTERPLPVDSQFKPHLKISLKSQKSSGEVRDEVSRLMGDLHREELTMRTTVTKENMTTTPTMIDLLLGNETMFFEDEEGSGDMDEALNSTFSNSTLVTTQRPLLFTTLINEVKSVNVTARPDPFEHLDYDLSDHSNSKKPRKRTKVDRLKKYKSVKLHGGAVGKVGSAVLNQKDPAPTIHAVTVKGKRRKTLRKLIRVDKMKKVKFLNHRVRAQNRMRLRKVLSKMIFGSRDRVATGHKSTKLRFVGSNGVVTPAPFSVDSARLNQIDSKTKRSGREKREVDEEEGRGGTVSAHLQVIEPDSAASGWDTAPIESSIIESINEEPHPAYHLVQRTQVEPSPMINEEAGDEESEGYEQYSEEKETVPVRNGLVHVALNGNSVNSETSKLRMVTLKSVKKVRKKENPSTNGVALVVPVAKKPTMLELLIGDFLGRVPPTAHSRYILQEQWS